MGDGLTISGGGSTAVATDELFLAAARLAAASATLGTWAGRAAGIAAELEAADLDRGAGDWAEPSPADATRRLEQALRRTEHDADELSASLIASAERYGWVERTVGSFWRIAGGIVAGWLGAAMSSPFGVLTALGIAANVGVAKAFGVPSLIDLVVSNPSLLSDPMFVRLVRTAVDSADELAVGAHLPGYGALGQLVGAPAAASISLALAAALGAKSLTETPVMVTRAAGDAPAGYPWAKRTVAAPAGVADLAARVPSGEGPQIRIERYGDVDEPRWVVYVSGTVEPALVVSEEPFDMKSNIAGLSDDSALEHVPVLGGQSGGGERAVRQAMDAAGVTPGDPVMVAGHSGGGIIAASLAGDPELNVVGSLSLGGPTATAALREGVPLLSVEHEEDLVPATGGWGHPSAERLVVSRSVLDAGTTYDTALPAHELARYRETAATIDESGEARLVAFRDLIGFTGGGSGVVSEWTATRVVSSSTGAR